MVTTIHPSIDSDTNNDEQLVTQRVPRPGDDCIYAPDCSGKLSIIYGELNCYVCGRSQYQRVILPDGSRKLKL